jgi:hypothetical protein
VWAAVLCAVLSAAIGCGGTRLDEAAAGREAAPEAADDHSHDASAGTTESEAHSHEGGDASHGHAHAEVYVCPMHPNVTQSTPGKCPICGMALVAAEPGDEYHVELSTSPSPARAGEPVELRITVKDAATHEVVRNMKVVHERPYHMFVIPQDLTHYDHVHPDQQADGSWLVKVTLPKPGYYKIYSDFLPVGGTPQVMTTRLLTAGYSGTAASAAAHLEPDQEWTKSFDGLRVTLDLPQGGLVAGRAQPLTFRLADAKTGAPVTDVEPYLGALGHTLILSEDTSEFVHAHPHGEPGQTHGGPDVTFEAKMPKPGAYRIWTQFKRRGEVTLTEFTVAVADPKSTATH